nr:probable prolyl 4-hydroxylase 10 [Ipomoea batatas]
MAKGKYGRGLPRKTTSSATTAFAVFVILSLVVLMLLAFGILSMPSSSRGSQKAHDLSTIAHNTLEQDEGNGIKGDSWVEVISWEPRAFVYHNFLVHSLQLYCSN